MKIQCVNMGNGARLYERGDSRITDSIYDIFQHFRDIKYDKPLQLTINTVVGEDMMTFVYRSVDETD